jgi:hypothetical protein
MLNRLLYEFYKSPNNGRQIASLGDGRRVLLVHSEIAGPATLRLMVARHETPRSIADFDDAGVLAGPDSIVPDGGPWGFGGSMVVAGNEIHVAWTGPHGIQHARATLVGNRFRWDRARQIFEGDYWLGDLFKVGKQLALAWHRTDDRQNESVGVAWLKGTRWQVQELQRGRPMFAPVADVDEAGRVHLAWSNVAEELFYARIDKLGAEPHVERLDGGKQPAILATGRQVLVVSGDEYGHLRYSCTDGQRWQRNVPLTATSPWLTSDEIHSPGLTRDHHGVAWLFVADNTRRSTFWARWMGASWSDITNGPRIFHRPPRFDFNLLPIGRLCVEKRSNAEVVRRQSQPVNPEVSRHRPRDIGLVLTCEAPIRRVEFRREVVPDLAADSPRKVLFLDMLEVAGMKNVRLSVEPAVKHPKNPLMQTGPAGSFDEDRVFNHGTVLLDGGKYRMWYGAIREPRRGEPRPPWYDWIKCGYAESDDGIHWKRVRVGLVEWNGSRENNIVPGLRHAPVVFKDDKDPDPQRRYKALYFWNSGEHLDIARTGKYGKQYDPRDELFLMDLFTSPDGIHLERHEGEVRFPGEQAKPLSAIPNSVFRDDDEPDPNKRYKAYGFMSLNLRRRGTSCLFSPDAQHWIAHPEMPLIDLAVRGIPPAVGGPTGQVHDTVCFPYEGYYLALYQDQHEPSNMPIELAVSRDAETFRHVQVGSQIIPVGDPDAWDAQTILPSMPVILDREIRLYYGGGTERKPPLNGRPKWISLPGLATLRRDGFTSIRLTSDTQPGSLVTIPFRLSESPRRLHVNVDCPAKSRLRAELLDHATSQPLPGYSLAECQPITGDHLDTPVTWTRNATLPRKTNLVRLRLELQTGAASPKLYAIWFQTS